MIWAKRVPKGKKYTKKVLEAIEDYTHLTHQAGQMISTSTV